MNISQYLSQGLCKTTSKNVYANQKSRPKEICFDFLQIVQSNNIIIITAEETFPE
jgi:hypothetical protein